MRVLVCGGRDFGCVPINRVAFDDAEALARAVTKAQHEKDYIRTVLAGLHAKTPFSLLIHGGARGADMTAGDWAENQCIPVEVYMAEWDNFGKAAGAMRNARMLREGRPDIVVAFPGGRGTADMVSRALAEPSVEVWEYQGFG